MLSHYLLAFWLFSRAENTGVGLIAVHGGGFDYQPCCEDYHCLLIVSLNNISVSAQSTFFARIINAVSNFKIYYYCSWLRDHSISKILATGAIVKTSLLVLEALSSIPGPVKSGPVSPTVRHRCDVFFEAALPRR